MTYMKPLINVFRIFKVFKYLLLRINNTDTYYDLYPMHDIIVTFKTFLLSIALMYEIQRS